MWLRVAGFALLFLLYLPGFAQEQVEPSVVSPRKSVLTFLYYLQPEHYDEAKAALPFIVEDRSVAEAADLAVKLKRVLDGQGIYIELEEVPATPNYVDSTANQNRYILTAAYPTIYLSKRGDRWVFGGRAEVEIEKAYRETFRFGTSKLLHLLPRTGTTKYMGLFLWQYFLLFFLLLFAVVTYKILTVIFEKFIIKVLTRYNKAAIAVRYIRPIAKPLSLFVVLLALWVLIPVVQLPADISRYLVIALHVAVPLFATIVFYRLVNVLSYYMELFASQTKSTLDDQLVPLVRKSLKAFVIIVGTFAVLRGLNVDLWPLLTGLSIGGLAFALAAQDTIKNFFGSLMIFIDRPFQIGDWITTTDLDGTVEEVGFRSTRIRTFRNSVTYVPNGKLADSTIDNHGLRQYRRYYTHISLTYDTPTDKIQAYIDGLISIVQSHPHTRKDYYNIYLNEFRASSLDVMLYIFFEVPDWSAELRARQEIMLQAIDLAKQIEVEFAFPTQTVHLANRPRELDQ